MKRLLLAFIICANTLLAQSQPLVATPSPSDQLYTSLPKAWDEGIPLGNAFVGALVWQKSPSVLRMSLDRIDLWDMRPSDSIVMNPKTFDWVYSKVLADDYAAVQRKYDHSYEANAAPSKIPGAALEFDISSLGEVASTSLNIKDGLCSVKWKNGAMLQTFVHADKPTGWFILSGSVKGITPELIAPTYNLGTGNGGSTEGQDLGRLGYNQGTIDKDKGIIRYHQKGYGDFFYDVVVRYKTQGNKLIGVWSITSSLSDDKADEITEQAMRSSADKEYKTHRAWWSDFWGRSSVALPDPVLQKQYDNEIYKFGSLTRHNGSIIPLQGVWTADNGKLPPWKGDVHHDLNTELSYWPTYKGNYLDHGYSMINTLWNQRETNRRYTKQFFGVDGLNVPGVATLKGEPMGGWIQYAFSPSISSWLTQNFYLHWRYSMDRKFLEQIAYPYTKEVATFIENFTRINDKGERVFPLSSSPEIYDNSVKAWFRTMTNYDVALVSYALYVATDMARELGLDKEAAHWASLRGELPDYSISEDGSMAFAEGHPYKSSHRHFSNAMAIHPMGLIDVTNSDKEKKIVLSTIETLKKYGSDYWVGYSFSWLANIEARAYDGKGAAQSLLDFANHFCSSNTFHLNGDQKKAGKSLFTYRPFTLEGNMAFASGVQEMLIQSHRGMIEIFPAIPNEWQDVSFKDLRTEGAFLVSAVRKGGKVVSIDVMPTEGGLFRLSTTAAGEAMDIKGGHMIDTKNGVLEIQTTKGRKFSIVL